MRFHHHHVWELGRTWWYVRSLPGELSLLPKLGVDSVASAGYHTLGGFGLMPYGYLPCVPPREVHWAEMQWSHVLAWGWPTPISCLVFIHVQSILVLLCLILFGRDSVVADGTGWWLKTLEPWFLLFTSNHSSAPGLSPRHSSENFAYLFLFWFLNFTIKNCKEKHTMKLTSSKDYNSELLYSWSSHSEQKLHVGFYTFIIEYILCTYPSSETKSPWELELEKQLALYHIS